MNKACSAIFLVLLFGQTAYAQIKMEKESRIRHTKEIPEKAKAFVDSLNFDGKIKWYREEGYKRSSVEAKSFRDKVLYSIEFDTAGNIEDVEAIIDWDAVPQEARLKIEQCLEREHIRHKIKKVQIQFSGDATKLIEFLKDKGHGQNGLGVQTAFEIVIKTKDKKSTTDYECLFDKNGNKISTLKIIPHNADHLLY